MILGLFVKRKIPCTWREESTYSAIVNAWVIQYTESLNSVSLPTESPNIRITLYAWKNYLKCKAGSLNLGAGALVVSFVLSCFVFIFCGGGIFIFIKMASFAYLVFIIHRTNLTHFVRLRPRHWVLLLWFCLMWLAIHLVWAFVRDLISSKIFLHLAEFELPLFFLCLVTPFRRVFVRDIIM